MSVTSIIIADELTKKFGEVKALDKISLQIKKGELFGLLGPNGAGKTTLISILSTMLTPTSGAAGVCGFDVRHQQDSVRRCIGVVFQDPSLDDELTGEENLDFHGRLYGMGGSLRKERIDAVLSLVDLQNRRKDLAKTYSGGMRRRLEIARGLMHRPEVLFLDEPTLGLDPQTRRRIWNYIRGLKDSFGMTIILTTHYMDEADHLCDRVAIIDKGKIVSLDTPEALKADMGGDMLELDVSDPDPRFLESVTELDDVAEMSLGDGKLLLTVRNGEAFIPDVMSRAQTYGVHIHSVSMRKPDLEDVFIKLTGREIRDETITEARDRIRIFMRQRKR